MSGAIKDYYGFDKPKLRGLIHAFSAGPFFIVGLILVAASPTLNTRIAVAIYTIAVTAMLTTSALYHRLKVSQRAQDWLRRADHSMIGVAVAGTYTPVLVLVTSGAGRITLLSILWAGALGAALLSIFYPTAPRKLVVAIYILLGWAGVGAIPSVISQAGYMPLVFILIGAAFYVAGASIYAKRSPKLKPEVFGFHELFHSFVVAAVFSQYCAVALLVAKLAFR